MAKNTVDDWSTTASNNEDVGGISIRGVARNSNVDNALREKMKQIAVFRDDLPNRYDIINKLVDEKVVAQTVPAAVKRVVVQYEDPDDATKAGELHVTRMSKADIDSLGIEATAYWRSVDRYLPNGATSSLNGGYWVNDSPIMKPAQFGAGFASAQAALNHHVKMGRTVDFGEGLTFTGTTASVLSVPSDSRILGDARFVFTDPDPTGTSNGTTIVTVGDDVKAEKLRIHEPGGAAGATSNYVVTIGNNPDIAHLEVTSETQRGRNGIYWAADTIVGKIGKIVTRDIDRPIVILNTTEAATRADTQIVIGDLDFENYNTGFRPQYVNFLVTGHVDIRGRSPNAEKLPGANAMLMQACGRAVFTNPIYLANAAEHAIRVGNPEGEADEDADIYLRIPWIFVRDCGGCGVKLTQKALTFSDVWIGGVTGTNIGCEAYGHGEELVRLSKMDNVYIGPINSFKTDGNFLEGYVHPVNGGDPVDLPNVFPRAAVQMQDCSNFRIGPIYGTYRAQFVDFYGESDLGDIGGGPVEDGTILIGNAVAEGSAAIRFYSTPATQPAQMTVGNLDIEFAGASGWTDNLYVFGRDADPGTDPYVEITAPVRMLGFIAGDVGPRNESDETGIGHELIDVSNLAWKHMVRRGRAQAMRRTAARVNQNAEIVAETANLFAIGDFAPTGHVINHSVATAGSGNYGMAFAEWTQLGSLDRGGAIAPIQTGSNRWNMGVDFLAGPSGGSTNALNLTLRLHHLGHLHAPRLPTYADNAAAISGGLVTHDIYKTSTGELRIVV